MLESGTFSGAADIPPAAPSAAPASNARRTRSNRRAAEPLPQAECRLIGMLLNGYWHDAVGALDAKHFTADWLGRAYAGIIALRRQSQPPVEYILDDGLPAGELAALRQLADGEHSRDVALLAHCARRIQRDVLTRQFQAAALAGDLDRSQALLDRIKQLDPAADSPADLCATLGIKSLADIDRTEYPPPKWAVPDILPEGLTLLAGAPKVKKSWMALGVGIAVASGGVALGKVPVKQGRVLYLALEDTERRLQKRARLILQRTGAAPALLDIVTDWPPMDKGGLERLRQYLKAYPDCRLVIIDTLAKVRPSKKRRDASYDDDYAVLSDLKRVADDAAVSLLVITHTRKAEADDFLHTVQGTSGVTGAVDGLLVLARPRLSDNAVLSITGRDIEEERALALSWDKTTCTWHIEGPAAEHAGSQAWLDICALLKGGPRTAWEIAVALHDPVSIQPDGPEAHAMRTTLARYRKQGKLDSFSAAGGDNKVRTYYHLPDYQPPNSANAANAQSTVAPVAPVAGVAPVAPVAQHLQQKGIETVAPAVAPESTEESGACKPPATPATPATVNARIDAEPTADTPSAAPPMPDSEPPTTWTSRFIYHLKDGRRVERQFPSAVPFSVADATGRTLHGDNYSFVEVRNP